LKLILETLAGQPVLTKFPNFKYPQPFFLSLQEARAFNHFKNKIRGSSLFINNNEARAFHFFNNKIRDSSLFVAQASSFIIITMTYYTAIYLEENL